MSELLPINPVALGAPRGYSNGMLGPVGGRLLFVAGQIGWNQDQELVSKTFHRQFGQALRNVVKVVEAAGGEAKYLARLTIFVTDKSLYLEQVEKVGVAYRKVMSKHFPAMALVEVKSLLDPGALVEIEGTAVLPAE